MALLMYQVNGHGSEHLSANDHRTLARITSVLESFCLNLRFHVVDLVKESAPMQQIEILLETNKSHQNPCSTFN